MNTSRTKAAVVGTVLAGGTALALLSPASPALAFLSGGLHLDVTAQSPATLVARVPLSMSPSMSTATPPRPPTFNSV
jgi:Na+/H+ antiporter NhaC